MILVLREQTMSVPDDLLTVRSPILNFFVLWDTDGLYLIDTGFIDGPRLLKRALRKRGWDRLPVRGILLTHGHLDHTLNTVAFAKRYGAWVAGPRLDAAGYDGTARYSGIARVTNLLEGIGRRIFRYRAFTPDRWIDPDCMLDVWGGLRAVHLPGHTPGHTGFYCERRRLLFTGDLFNSYLGFGYRPPAIFNAHPEQIPASIATALELDLDGVLPNHSDSAPPGEHLRRLRRLHQRLCVSR
jgi:glyoxylase-like metal-dependent hydrolase (beta-lactamase superfamily II)